MNKTLLKNIKEGHYGLKKLMFGKQQLAILKNYGYIPEDVQIDEQDD